MSYPRDLDEYSEEELLAELNRRTLARRAGKCPYCSKPLHSSPACRFERMHSPVRANPTTVHCTIVIEGPAGSGKTVMAQSLREFIDRTIDATCEITERQTGERDVES